MSGRNESGAMVGTLTGVAVVCGLLIVTAYQLTKPTIAKNKAEQLKASVFEVLPGSTRTDTIQIATGGRVHAGYGEDGSLIGVAVEAKGQGFQDFIRVLYGYSPSLESIIGLKILDSKETPGLGDKIEKDPDFRENFSNLDVHLSAEGTLINEIVAVKNGEKTKPWQVDGITGATISSKAIARLLNASASQQLSKVREAIQ